jgi:hypothetical protein
MACHGKTKRMLCEKREDKLCSFSCGHFDGAVVYFLQSFHPNLISVGIFLPRETL